MSADQEAASLRAMTVTNWCCAMPKSSHLLFVENPKRQGLLPDWDAVFVPADERAASPPES